MLNDEASSVHLTAPTPRRLRAACPDEMKMESGAGLNMRTLLELENALCEAGRGGEGDDLSVISGALLINLASTVRQVKCGSLRVDLGLGHGETSYQ